MRESGVVVKEWICKEEPLIRADGASVGVGFRQMTELVRCKDCKYCGSEIRDGIKFAKCELKHNWMPQPEWFCSDGERRDDDG